MSGACDLIVIGAGPAGGEAALVAATQGLKVTLIDEGPAAGGQVWRAPRTAWAKDRPADFTRARGDDLRTRLAAASLTRLQGAAVWDMRPGFSVSCITPQGAQILKAPRAVLATGATERIYPFEGWTTPGVFGLAAATALIKSEGALPGREIVIAGQGPLLIAVAAKALSLGLRPLAIADRAGHADWARALPGFANVPSMALAGARWMARIALAGVPIHRGSEVVCATGGDCLSGVTIRNLANGKTTEIATDTLYIGNGLSPADEIHRLLGLEQQADPLRGGYRTLCDEDRRSSLPGLYVAGDGSGVHGALPSAVQGRLAGLAAARDHGALDAARHDAEAGPLRRRLKRYIRFADASCRLMQFPETALDRVSDSTVICRCEDVSAGDILGAMADQARELNQLKHPTRLGMGPCQGRMCSMNAACLLRRRSEIPATDLRMTPRAPIRPIEMEDLIGTFDYADIPVPETGPAMSECLFDLAVVGGGIQGASAALFAQRAGMKVVLLERDALARGASGVNAGTLTMQMTRAALIPYALKAYEMWLKAPEWLGHDVGAAACDGLSLAFTEAEEQLLEERANARSAAGAPIELISPAAALRIEPGINPDIRMASHCSIDGYANAYLTGLAYHRALTEAGVDLREYTAVNGMEPSGNGYDLRIADGAIQARQVALTGGVWIEPMLAWLGIDVPIKTLINQLAVTERCAPVMRTVVGIASGLLSLKQYPHGTVVIGGGWQGEGSRDKNTHNSTHVSTVGNARLATHAIPALRHSRLVRVWTGFEAETADALPAVGPVPRFPGVWVCGSAHSGYTSAPYIAHCLTQAILGADDMPLFPIDRLLNRPDIPHAPQDRTANDTF